MEFSANDMMQPSTLYNTQKHQDAVRKWILNFRTVFKKPKANEQSRDKQNPHLFLVLGWIVQFIFMFWLIQYSYLWFQDIHEIVYGYIIYLHHFKIVYFNT